MFDLSGRVALITGASSGLGAYFAQVISERGAQVVLGARRAERLSALTATIKAGNGEADAVTLDVTDLDSVRAAFDHAEARYGAVDLVINNAGIAQSGKAINTEDESWDAVMDTNLKGAWRVARESGLRLINAGREGSIVNVSSILGLRGAPSQASYAASKAGVIRLTEVLALEWMRHGIRVNALCPGYIKTEMNAEFFDSPQGKAFVRNIPARRLGTVEELKAPLLLLAASEGSFINGVAFTVDGGHLFGGL